MTGRTKEGLVVTLSREQVQQALDAQIPNPMWKTFKDVFFYDLPTAFFGWSLLITGYVMEANMIVSLFTGHGFIPLIP